MVFFDAHWQLLGLRLSLAADIAALTGILEELLLDGYDWANDSFLVADKFSWASKRETARGEDRAYSLMVSFIKGIDSSDDDDNLTRNRDLGPLWSEPACTLRRRLSKCILPTTGCDIRSYR